jgi:hypothetical protein
MSILRRTAMPEPGELIQHKMSLRKYWYIDKIPQSRLHSIVDKENNTAYTVATRELELYYQKAANDDLKVGGRYKSTSTGSTFQVEAIYITPNGGEKVAFGWYSFDNDASGIVHAHIAPQHNWSKWRAV